jgi:VWFA-related protein
LHGLDCRGFELKFNEELVGKAHKFCYNLAPILIALGMLAVCVQRAGRAEAAAIGSDPAAQIDLAKLGYTGLSAAARQSGGANLSVDFLDAEHVLVTFNPKKLFKRLPECPPSHADRQVHAMVIAVPGGSVVKESDWYLHDSRRYVWRLGDGHVLLRRLNKLYEVDSDLEEKLIFDSPQELQWVSVTPDGKQVIVETGTPAPATVTKAGDAKNDVKVKERVKISFIDVKTSAVQRSIDVRGITKLEATSSGFADVRKQASNWLVEFGNNNITRVKARRVPNLLYSSNNTVLVGRCAVSRDGYNVSAFTVAGTFLWRQHWDDCRYSPVVRGSEDGSRFASGTVTIRPADQQRASAEEASQEEGLEQHVQVLDTATGKSLLSLVATPAVPDGQNFSLSPDGTRLAVVVGTTMDVYALPEMLPEERAHFLAVKAETPGLTAPPAQASKADEPVFESSGTFDASQGEAPAEIAKTPQAAPEGTPTKADAAMEATPTLTIRTGTQVVALDVVVTDNAGKLVKGLQQSDFGVTEDGKPQRVKFFKEFTQGQVEEAATVLPARGPLPPNVFSNYALPPESAAVTVVMLDLLNTPIQDQIRAQDELVSFLKKKPKDTKIAICVLGNQLQMIQGFTDDPGTLLAAAKGKKASQRLRPLDVRDAEFDIGLREGRESSRFAGVLQFLTETVAQQQSELRLIDADNRMFVTVDAFAHIARYLDGIPGRKNLVWLSGSFLLGIIPESNGSNPFLENAYYTENLKKVANLLGDAHVAVYPVSVKGLETNPLFAAANNDLAPVTMTAGPPGAGFGKRVPGSSVANAVMMDRMDEFSLGLNDEHATMTKLATQTGGQAFFNTNDLSGAIKAATEQGANYYALSYTPTNKNYNGAFRKLKVTLAGKRYHLAYRTGYYAIDPFAPLRPSKDLTSSLARAAMQQGSPQSRQIVFGARVVPVGKPRIVQEAGSARPTKKKKHEEAPVEMQRYGIDHAVAFSDLRFTPTPEGKYHGVVNFMVTAFDSEGKQIASQLSQSVADLKPEVMKDIMAGGVRVHQEIDVPVNGVAMRLGVEDVSNSHVGTMEIRLPVPAPPESQESARRTLPPVEPD